MFIADHIVNDPKLSQGAKLCYGVLSDTIYSIRHSEGHLHWPSQLVIAKRLGVQERQLRDYIKELKEAGKVRVVRVGLGENNQYEAIP
jgi:DNA-binding Lrp family transcriptional regulator